MEVPFIPCKGGFFCSRLSFFGTLFIFQTGNLIQSMTEKRQSNAFGSLIHTFGHGHGRPVLYYSHVHIHLRTHSLIRFLVLLHSHATNFRYQPRHPGTTPTHGQVPISVRSALVRKRRYDNKERETALALFSVSFASLPVPIRTAK